MKIYVNHSTGQSAVMGEKNNSGVSNMDMVRRGFTLTMFINGSWDSVINTTTGKKVYVLETYKQRLAFLEEVPLTQEYQLKRLQVSLANLSKRLAKKE